MDRSKLAEKLLKLLDELEKRRITIHKISVNNENGMIDLLFSIDTKEDI